MATYEITDYGRDVYGAPLIVQYLADPFIASSLDYGSIGVSWEEPQGTIFRYRLLGNRYGYPADQNDGSILLDQADYPGSFYLDLNVIPASYHYYGLFLQVDDINDVWLQAGVAGCLATSTAGSGARLLDNLPGVFTQSQTGDNTQDATGSSYLAQYLGVLGWGIDYVQTQYDVELQHLNDPMAIPLRDLRALTQQLGITWNPKISAYLMRKAAANWGHVCAERGTLLGIANHISLLTGWGVDLQRGANLLLGNDQSEFPDPAYPPYFANRKYFANERVQHGNFLYTCAIAGTWGTAPTGTSSSNANWTVILDADDTTATLTNPVTGGVNTWEVIYPGASNGAPLANSIKEGLGVENPLSSSDFTKNGIRIYNKGGSAQDLIARSVSRLPGDITSGSATWNPDPLQAIGDGIPVPWVRDSQAWDPSVRYGTGAVVLYQGLPFLSLRASTGATPPASTMTATPEWAPLSTSRRIRLMLSAYTSQSLSTGSALAVPVATFVDWFDQAGIFIGRCIARTPTAGTPGIPDKLAFDAFTQKPAGTISARAFDNGYVNNWIAQVSDFTISGFAGGSAYPVTPGTRAMALVTTSANGQVGVTYRTAATGGQVQGIVFRWTSDSNYWRASSVSLAKKVSGSFTTVTTYATPAQPGDRMIVQMNGTAISVLINGVQVATTTDSFNQTATSAGMVVE